jgi:hypothetical protein
LREAQQTTPTQFLAFAIDLDSNPTDENITDRDISDRDNSDAFNLPDLPDIFDLSDSEDRSVSFNVTRESGLVNADGSVNDPLS